jgi:hypothetical protein
VLEGEKYVGESVGQTPGERKKGIKDKTFLRHFIAAF